MIRDKKKLFVFTNVMLNGSIIDIIHILYIYICVCVGSNFFVFIEYILILIVIQINAGYTTGTPTLCKHFMIRRLRHNFKSQNIPQKYLKCRFYVDVFMFCSFSNFYSFKIMIKNGHIRT